MVNARSAAAVDLDALGRQVSVVNRLLQADAGSIEVLSVSEKGVVHIRFGGMCTGCMSKPLTTQSTVRPLLLEVPGVTDVAVVGARISDEARVRIVQATRRAAEVARQAAGEQIGAGGVQ